MPAAQDRAPGDPVGQLQPKSSLEISFSQETLLFSAAISALFSYSLEPEHPCAPLLPAAHLFQASGGTVSSQAVIPKPEQSFPAAQFSRSGLWSCFSCDPRWSRGCCPHHLLLFLSSAVVEVSSPCAPHTGPSLSANPQSTSSGCILHTLVWE